LFKIFLQKFRTQLGDGYDFFPSVRDGILRAFGAKITNLVLVVPLKLSNLFAPLSEIETHYITATILLFTEGNLNPVRVTSTEVYDLQERMEHLQTVRARNWSEKMAEMGRERSELGDKITSSLKEIEESSGIFLIKPVYSYVSMYVFILNFY
jgi:hypothetical protein